MLENVENDIKRVLRLRSTDFDDFLGREYNFDMFIGCPIWSRQAQTRSNFVKAIEHEIRLKLWLPHSAQYIISAHFLRLVDIRPLNKSV